jgi:sulfur-carrier protein
MITIEFLGPIQKESLMIDAKKLKDVSEYLKSDPELKEWLNNSAVAVNDKLVNSLEFELKDGDRVSLLPPVCGG